MNDLNEYERTLLAGWESTYKMGQLGLWLMLALRDGPKHMTLIKQFMQDATDDVMSADGKSIYRALRRYDQAGLLDFSLPPSASGPELKVYGLTETGRHVLSKFLARNVAAFYNPNIYTLIGKGMS